MIDFKSKIGTGSNFFFTFEINEILDDKFENNQIESLLDSIGNEVSIDTFKLNVNIQSLKENKDHQPADVFD